MGITTTEQIQLSKLFGKHVDKSHVNILALPVGKSFSLTKMTIKNFIKLLHLQEQKKE